MLRYIANRLLLWIPSVVVVMLGVYALAFYGAGDPIKLIFLRAPGDVAYDPTRIEAIRESAGLNKPFIEQFLNYLLNLLHGNFGNSLVNGRSVKSCTMLAVQAAGQEIITAEGLASGGQMHPVQEAFRQEHGLQCGFCTPGMVMAAAGLLAENPHPTEAEVREGLEGNFCRCTGYHNIVRAVLTAAESMSA